MNSNNIKKFTFTPKSKLIIKNLINNDKDINTFKDLYKFLINDTKINLIEWIKNPWKGKDKQESLLRLFAGLGLISKLKNYKICIGNFNKRTIKIMDSHKEIFLNNNNELIYLKDKGDSSDLTGINENDEKNILATTSKNLNKTNVGKLEIEKIFHNFYQYEKDGFKLTLCIVIRDNLEFEQMKKQIESSNKNLSDILNQSATITIDWNDLKEAHNLFVKNFSNIDYDTLTKTSKKPLCLKMHQDYCVNKIIELKKSHEKALLGCLPRSGKSYIIAGSIIKDSIRKKECNYVIITTAPKETFEQYVKILDNLQLEKFKVYLLTGTNKSFDVENNKNIIICSKQFLESKLEEDSKINWLENINFDIRFIDESHNGGTTMLAQKILNTYGKDCFTVMVTATYCKPINDYYIPKEEWILWDIEDVRLCKNIFDDEEKKDLLMNKHKGLIDSFNLYSPESIKKEYEKIPDLHLLSNDINEEVVKEINEKSDVYGWSTEGCFLLKQGVNDNNGKKYVIPVFQNEEKMLDLAHRIFGKYDGYGIPDRNYPDNKVFMKRIENICKNPNYNSRFIGNSEEPIIVLAFLPQNNIELISKTFKNLLEKNTIIPEYDILCINSKITNNPKELIQESQIKAKNSNKKGLLVLSGKQCHLGVSLNYCDIVILLNNNKSFDMTYQMVYRCMTEDINKKCGFVIDLNIHRTINFIAENAFKIKPNYEHPQDAFYYLLNEKLINLNIDKWINTFGDKLENSLKNLSKWTYKAFSSFNSNINLKNLLNKIKLKTLNLENEEQIFINENFKKGKQENNGANNNKDNKEEINNGVDKDKVNTNNKNQNNNESKSEKKVIEEIKFIDVIRHIIPLVCILTIYDGENRFKEMFEIIESDSNLRNILLKQTKCWWGKNIDFEIISKLINIFLKYMENDTDIINTIRVIKDIFHNNRKNTKKLSEILDEYLIPHELEKKNNAEISTPYLLRQEMLDKIPKDFWTTPKRVFEPCSGKSGFLLDVIDRFMNGLKSIIPDKNLRYKKIVEECLYFSDINATNIYISKLLLDPDDEYELNYNEGNTLELNIKSKWNIDGFHAVIGNPPYESKNATGDNKLYLEFIEYSINNLCKDWYLLFVVPTNIKNYLTNQNKNRSYIKTFMEILYLSVNTSNKYFKNVSNYFSYFLLKKTIVKNCSTNVSFVRKKQIEFSKITINEGDKLPLCLSLTDIKLINKVSNLIQYKWNTFDIKKALYKKNNNKKECTQRIRKTHINKGDIKVKSDDEFKYKIIDKINIGNPFPGVYYYNNYKMLDYGKSKVIMCTGGYLMPTFDKEGFYNLSDNMLYLLVNSEEEFNGLTILINSQLIKYLNKVTMTDNIHGRDVVIKNIRHFDLKTIKNEEDIYKVFEITDDEIEIIKKTI